MLAGFYANSARSMTHNWSGHSSSNHRANERIYYKGTAANLQRIGGGPPMKQ